MTLDVLLWTFLASFVVHIVDETTMNGGFVAWFRASFWPTYTAKMNFWFNGGAVLAITASNVLADLLGGHWVILALIWPFGFALHGVTLHLFWRQAEHALDVLAGDPEAWSDMMAERKEWEATLADGLDRYEEA